MGAAAELELVRRTEPQSVSGILERCLDSKLRANRRLETPELVVRYRAPMRAVRSHLSGWPQALRGKEALRIIVRTHLSYTRVVKHLNAGIGSSLLADLTADMIETFLRARLTHRVEVNTTEGKVAKRLVKPSTVHQEYRVLRRMLNVAVRKKLLASNPCAGVEFPVRVKGLFRPHYMTWSEQEKIETGAPVHYTGHDYSSPERIRRSASSRRYRSATRHGTGILAGSWFAATGWCSAGWWIRTP